VQSPFQKLQESQDSLRYVTEMLNETEQVGKVGGWELNLDTGLQTWTNQVYTIHEIDQPYVPTLDKGINFYTEASRPVIEQAVKKAIEQQEPFNVELEITTAKGHLRSVNAIGKPDPSHHRLYGFFQDITERKRIEDQVRQLAFHDALTQFQTAQ
jgi:PAS domain-containing protein